MSLRRIAILLGLLLAPLQGAQRADAPHAAAHVELYFELKLLLRDRVFLKPLALDQWAGGRLLMRGRSEGDLTGRALVRPLEDPWVFRWYPGKHDVKLGAAVWVPHPEGDPYRSLAERLLPEVRRRYELWWQSDRVQATAEAGPEWATRADKFWTAQHRLEAEDKDPLPASPVYPFHVLGDAAERLSVVSSSKGMLLAGSLRERMSRPWLADGWRRALGGERVEGYGYWEVERPDWEPRTYEAFTDALRLLGWSCFKDQSAEASSAVGIGGSYTLAAAAVDALGSPRDASFAGEVSRVVETLNPRAAGWFSWRDSPPTRFTVEESAEDKLVLTGESAERPLGGRQGVRYRLWRHAVFERRSQRMLQDELQLLASDPEERSLKLWIKVGFRPYPNGNEA